MKRTKISDLQANEKVINLVATVESLEPAVENEQTGKRVQDGYLEDSTGQVKFTLWGDEVDTVKEKDKIILNGWCKTYQDDLQVTTGKFGKIRIVPPEHVEE